MTHEERVKFIEILAKCQQAVMEAKTEILKLLKPIAWGKCKECGEFQIGEMPVVPATCSKCGGRYLEIFS